jgi:hypothetical protein
MYRYNKIHASVIAHLDARDLFHKHSDLPLSIWTSVDTFARAMPEELKFNESIDDITAYRLYLANHKPWASWKLESRKPTWWSQSITSPTLDVDHSLQRAIQN